MDNCGLKAHTRMVVRRPASNAAERAAMRNRPRSRAAIRPATPVPASRCTFLAGTMHSLLILLIAAPLSRAAGPTRPNILYLFADDQSYRSVGAYHSGWRWVKTPNIDSLARKGIRFDSAYCGSWCLPSRVTILTGLQPHSVRGFDPATRTFDPAACRFWPAAFRSSGYETAFIGKWHIKGYGDQNLWSRDWDHWVAWDHTREGNGGYYGERSNDGAQLLNIDGVDRREREYPTDNYTRHAVDFIESPHNQPWFLWVCYGASHAPYVPAPRHADAYEDDPVDIPSDVFGPRPDKARIMRDFTMFRRGQSPGDPARYATNYLTATIPECVRTQNRTSLALDEGVGKIIEALRRSGQLSNTLIVYASDDGFPWGEQGFANKNGPYDACQRTPLIVSWPGHVPEGAVCRSPVGQIDLVPTFFTASGIPVPWPMQGHDLSPLFADPDAEWDHPVLLEYLNERFGEATEKPSPADVAPKNPWEPPAWWLSIRLRDFVYVRWLVEDTDELYNLRSDPAQLHNLAALPAPPPELASMRSLLLSELRRTSAAIAGHLPRIVPLEPPDPNGRRQCDTVTGEAR